MQSFMCVNPLINKEMCEKDGQEFGSLEFLYTQSHLYIKITTGSLPLVINLGRNSSCGQMPFIVSKNNSHNQ